MKAILIGMMMLLAVTAGAQEQQLSGEQQDACGAILCLAGGGATPECRPYLEKFYDKDPDDRTDFLKKCPNHGLSQGAIKTLARYGKLCYADNLAAYLNQGRCNGLEERASAQCQFNKPNDWKLCAAYYSELTTDEPPRLVQRCRDVRGTTGGVERACGYWWVTRAYATGSWCKDKDASCKETDVRGETNHPIVNR